jgi:hypothetical protein
MKEVTIEGLHPDQVLRLVGLVKNDGLIQGKDFDWSYHRPLYNDRTYELIYDRRTVFKFYNDEHATWFSLRYQ